MDLASIDATYEGLKIGKDILKSLFDSKVDEAAKEKKRVALFQFGDAQDTLFSVREELFKLQAQ